MSKTNETVSVQGVIVDKWAFTQAFNGGVGNGMEKERKRIHKLLDNLIAEYEAKQPPNYQDFVGAWMLAKIAIEEKYTKRLKG